MPVQYKDYYSVLGVAKDATHDEIKKAFRKIARKYHPDVAKGTDKAHSDKKFKEANEAYEVIGDEAKRKKYDALGDQWKDYGAGEPYAGSSRTGGYNSGGRHTRRASDGEGHEFHFDGTGFSDFFEQYFGGVEHGAGRGQPFSMPGADVEAEISVNLEEVLHGSNREISLRKFNRHTGSETTQNYKIKIPAGIREGQRIRLAGQGEMGSGRGDSGHLFLRVRFAPHPFLRASGETLYYDLELAPWEAVLGTTLKIQSLDGKVHVTIPSGTANGRQLRLRGLGLPAGNGKRGDLYIKVSIEVPAQVGAEERTLWETLAARSKFKPRGE